MQIEKHRAIVDLRAGEKGEIIRFTDDRIANKMMTMGVFPGATLKLIRYSPFRGSCYVKIQNMALALRKSEAACVLLQTDETE